MASSQYSFKNTEMRTKEMSQQLRVLAGLIEHLGSAPTGDNYTAPAPGMQGASTGTYTHLVYIQPYRHTQIHIN